MNDKQNSHTTTTFQMSNHLHTQLKMMCILTKKSMGEFIRLAIIDKIKELKVRENEQSHDRKTTRTSD
jgi:hypothetical protein